MGRPDKNNSAIAQYSIQIPCRPKANTSNVPKNDPTNGQLNQEPKPSKKKIDEELRINYLAQRQVIHGNKNKDMKAAVSMKIKKDYKSDDQKLKNLQEGLNQLFAEFEKNPAMDDFETKMAEFQIEMDKFTLRPKVDVKISEFEEVITKSRQSSGESGIASEIVQLEDQMDSLTLPRTGLAEKRKSDFFECVKRDKSPIRNFAAREETVLTPGSVKKIASRLKIQ